MDDGVKLHSRRMEIALLNVLSNKKLTPDITDRLTVDDFYNQDCKLIYEAMIRVSQKDIDPDVVAIVEELKQSGDLQKVGGILGITNILGIRSVVKSNLEYYIEQVLEYSHRRQADMLLQKVVLDYKAGTASFAECIDACKTLNESFGYSEKTHFADWQGAMQREYDSYLQRMAAVEAGGIYGVSTGYDGLDTMTAGLKGGELIILAGRPSMGKTAFALNLIYNAAISNNQPSALISLEMSTPSLVERLICRHAGINTKDYQFGRLPSDAVARIKDFRKAQVNLYIADDLYALEDIRRDVRSAVMRMGVKLVVIDYLQLIQMRRKGKDANRQQEVSDISRSLKLLAKELDVPIIALSQLNRGVEGRQNKRPMLSDLRESGAIEQDADIVLFLHREGYYKQGEDDGHTELIFAKHRNGPLGTLHYDFQKDVGTFIQTENWGEDTEEPPRGWNGTAYLEEYAKKEKDDRGGLIAHEKYPRSRRTAAD